MTDEYHGDRLVDLAERMNTRSQFVELVKVLAINLRQHPDEWQNNCLLGFVQGLAGFVENMDGYYENMEIDVDCDVPSWRVFAEALLAARYRTTSSVKVRLAVWGGVTWVPW